MAILRHHELACDILVAGGGMAGVCCALAAARCGAKVILCQDRPVLGGNASSEVRMHICGADAGRGIELATEAREGGIIEEIRLENCVRNPQRSPSMADLILYEKCRAEPNLTLMLNTSVVAAEVESGKITHALAERQSTEDRFRIAANIFVDCTGDGRLGAEAGASFRSGREGSAEFGESLAQAQPDNLRLGSSLLFLARDMGRPVPFIPPPWARKFTEEDLRLRGHARRGPHGTEGAEYGYWWIEWGGQLDTIKDNETIRDELLAILLGVWDHIKNGGDHGAENWALEWFGFLPGKRESRRFIGQYTLTESDVMQSRPFPDAIAYGGWPIDTHPPLGIDAPDEKPCAQHPVPHLYDIPLRCCISRDIANLMFAGRNISATHVAFASTRVMATCAVVGQGVGTAAAYAVKSGRLPSDLADDASSMRRIQQQLLRDDAYLIGVVNEDENDVAPRAHISASSEHPSGGAYYVISGQTRAVHGDRGAPPGRANPGTHRWMSDPGDGLPVWIELSWDYPIHPREVRLVFDTGLHRPLRLSYEDAAMRGVLWGQPQPETVRDYLLEGLCDGKWKSLVKVTGNYQRLRIHPLDGSPITALRLTVQATNGLDHARVCEVRVLQYDQQEDEQP